MHFPFPIFYMQLFIAKFLKYIQFYSMIICRWFWFKGKDTLTHMAQNENVNINKLSEANEMVVWMDMVCYLFAVNYTYIAFACDCQIDVFFFHSCLVFFFLCKFFCWIRHIKRVNRFPVAFAILISRCRPSE